MPDMNGLEVMAALCADPATGDIPVIMITGSRLNAADYASLKARRNFLFLEEKPAGLGRLMEKIEYALHTGAIEPGKTTASF